MFTCGSRMKRGVAVITPFIIFTLFVTVAATVKQAYPQDEAIDVSCYKGISQEGIYVGNVTVTKPASAGETCNSTYYDCDGKCVGCYYDQNLSKTICFDKSGGTVAKYSEKTDK